MAKALLILDAQNICPTAPRQAPAALIGHGEYPALSGREVAEPLLSLARAIVGHHGTVYAARTAGTGVAQLCVRGTSGADLNPRLRMPRGAVIVAPSDGGARVLGRTDRRGRSLGDLLHRGRFSEVLVGGLTTSDEFRDAVAELRGAGIPTAVLVDAVFALDAAPGERPPMTELAAEGARIISTGQAVMELYGWRDEYPPPTAATPEPFPPGREIRARGERGWRKMWAGLAQRRDQRRREFGEYPRSNQDPLG